MLHQLIYESCSHDFGITKHKETNKAHFKEKVLNHFITQEQNDRKNVIATLVFEQEMQLINTYVGRNNISMIHRF